MPHYRLGESLPAASPIVGMQQTRSDMCTCQVTLHEESDVGERLFLVVFIQWIS